MHVLFIANKDAKTALSRDLQGKLTTLLVEKKNALEILEVGSSDVVPCLGCLLCMTKCDRECTSNEATSQRSRAKSANGPGRQRTAATRWLSGPQGDTRWQPGVD